jgi:5-methylcytosine-specific restriction endonuclease McrA
VTGYLNGRTEARYPKPARRVKAKPKKRIRAKSKRKAKLHDADRLFSQYIRTRDGWACTRCGSPFNVQCAHLIGRAYRSIRFNPMNATALCSKCHIFYTHRPLEWMDYCEEKWPGRFATLRVQALAAHEHPDYDAVCESLRLAIGVRNG